MILILRIELRAFNHEICITLCLFKFANKRVMLWRKEAAHMRTRYHQHTNGYHNKNMFHDHNIMLIVR